MKRGYDYDLIVIGAGIAGMVSAVTAVSLGKSVAVVEKSRVGGNCTNLTCIPSKALIRLGHTSRDMAHLERLGLLTLPDGGLDRTRYHKKATHAPSGESWASRTVGRDSSCCKKDGMVMPASYCTIRSYS